MSSSSVPDNVFCMNLSRATVLPALHLRKADQSTFTLPASLSSSIQLPSPQQPFVTYSNEFLKILGPKPSLRVLCESKDGMPAFHEAGVWFEETKEVFFTSNRIDENIKTDPKTGLISGYVSLSKVAFNDNQANDETTSSWHDLPLSTSLPSSNGACLYNGSILVCDQGYGSAQASGLVLVDPKPPYAITPLLNNFHGRPFNSLNDVVVLETSLETGGTYQTIWFTDPTYGYHQDYRPEPELPSQVYCFDPATGYVRAVADGFVKPNGIAFNSEGTKCYVTDTGLIVGNGVTDGAKPGTIYVFDVVYPPTGIHPSVAGPTLQNRRMFAFADCGAPDGIKLDKAGNVYSGCFDGIHVWNEYGTLIGKITLPRGEGFDVCANFCFIPDGRIVAMAEDRMYLVEGLQVEGALL